MGRLQRAPIWLLGVLVVVTVTFLVSTAVVVVLTSEASLHRAVNEVQGQGASTRRTVLENRRQLAHLVCDVARDQTLTLAGIRALAHRFGVTIAQLPGEHPLTCKAGADPVVIGTDGPDRLLGTGHPDFISGRLGNDVLRGRGGDDAVFGDGGRDRLWAGNGADRLYGGAGDDVLRARADD